MVTTPQCSFPEADITKGAQYSGGSMTALRDFAGLRHFIYNVCFSLSAQLNFLAREQLVYASHR